METAIRIFFAELRDNPRTRMPPPPHQEFIDEFRRLRLRRGGIPKEHQRQYDDLLESLAVREKTWRQLIKNYRQDLDSKKSIVGAKEKLDIQDETAEERKNNIKKQKLLMQLYRKQKEKCTELGLKNPESLEEYIDRMAPTFNPGNLQARFVFDRKTGKTYFKSSA